MTDRGVSPRRSTAVSVRMTEKERQALIEERSCLKEKISSIREQLMDLRRFRTGESDFDSGAERSNLLREKNRWEARVEEIDQRINSAKIIEEGCQGEKVEVGPLITIRFLDGPDQGKQINFRISDNGNRQLGIISTVSPLGAAVLGCCKGDEVEYQAPGGKRRVLIVAVG